MGTTKKGKLVPCRSSGYLFWIGVISMIKMYYAHPMSTGGDVTVATKDAMMAELAKYVKDQYQIIDPSTYGLKDEDSPIEIVSRNKHDILECDIVIADFTLPSTGVAAECSFAKSNGIPVIALASKKHSAWVDHLATMVAFSVNGVVSCTKICLKA